MVMQNYHYCLLVMSEISSLHHCVLGGDFCDILIADEFSPKKLQPAESGPSRVVYAQLRNGRRVLLTSLSSLSKHILDQTTRKDKLW